MITTTSNISQNISVLTIPDAMIYEWLDGQGLGYKGYEEVLEGKKKLEDIMGSSAIQVVIISAILRFLYKNLPEDQYEIVTNEAGIHIDNKNNLAMDIAIYQVEILKAAEIGDKYLDVVPTVVIEVDTKADTEDFESAINYYHSKTEKLLNFGVEKVIWITSSTEKVMVALPDADWTTSNWNKEIEVLDGIRFSVGKLLNDRKIIVNKED
ncbi:MAG: hypothetical protein R3E32_23395 [Chitinophagales bacterium]